MGHGGTHNRLTQLAWACGAAVLLAGVVLATAPGSSAGPLSEKVVMLTSTTDVGQTPYSIPGSISLIHVVAVGAQGGAADCGCLSPDNALPGKGARVEADLSVEGGSKAFLNVGGAGSVPNIGDGGSNGGGDGTQDPTGGSGGGGGGASDVRTISRSQVATTLASRLIVAAGGGGAGSDGNSCLGAPSPTGGAGGDAAAAGSTAGGGTAEARGGGGGAGTQSDGGGAGFGGTSDLGNADPGIAGSLGLGGAGGTSSNLPGGEGGGGGGGLYGGGGGGGGTNVSDCPLAGGGGGGGGSSLVPAGGAVSLPDPVVPASITITATTPRSQITDGPPKVVRTRGRKKAVSFEFDSPSGAAGFECSLDRRAYMDCASPLKRKFRRGRHLVRVRAVNLIGNADQTPAKARFRVKGA